MCFLVRFASALVAGLMLLSLPSAHAIEAVKGKKYFLTKRHGPWMIMVASFKQPPPERRSDKGLTPEQAADELVYELRKQGIPAYTYSQKEVREEVETTDALDRKRKRQFIANQQNYCVLAGNYDSNEETTKGGKLAKDTLAWIEDNFKPEFLMELNPNFERAKAAERSPLRQLKSGGVWQLTPNKLKKDKDGKFVARPLAGAFLTLNPLLTAEEVQARKRDPLLVKLNAGNELSLYNNPRKYTLVVASFYGKSSKAQVGMMGLANFRDAQKTFKVGEALDEAAQDAWELATLLRRGNFVVSADPATRVNGQPRKLPGGLSPLPPGQTRFESWIWHDRFKSVVTVGSFDRVDDPRIAQFQAAFGAKVKEHAQTKKPFLAAEQLTVPAILKGNQLPEKSWIFDPKPQLVEVPWVNQ